MKLTEQEFLQLIKTSDAGKTLAVLAEIPAEKRRAFAKPAMALYKKLDRYWDSNSKELPPKVKDTHAVTVGMLATATASDLKKLSFFPHSTGVPLEDLFRALDPVWTQAVVDHFVEQRTFYVERFRPLWRAGLCKRPESDAIILHYYSRWAGSFIGAEEEELLSNDVWRFFEVEGGGEDSLANHDKYLKKGKVGWAERLKAFSDNGRLDRQRLLDASLDALDQDFGQYRAGWYARFHILMEPDIEETSARADRYLRLLSSAVPPTVSFALKQVQALEKAKAINPTDLVSALEPAVQARAKGTVLGALRLLQSAANRQPDLQSAAAEKAVLALISEDAAVQEKALDVIEGLGADGVTSSLEDYVDLVAPSVRSRIASLSGTQVDSVETAGLPAAQLVAERVEPVGSAEAALALFLTVLEDSQNPFDVERAVDGISRFGTALREDGSTLSPLAKRAKQICKNPGESEVRFVLAMTGRALAEGADLGAIQKEESKDRADYAFISKFSLQEAHLNRNIAVLKRINAGIDLPLLCLPSDTSGHVQASDLLARVGLYREAGVAPDVADLAFALMRLKGSEDQHDELPTETEVDRAIAYALGEKVSVGPSPELWAAAWVARNPKLPDKAVANLFKSKLRKVPTPDCGVPLKMELLVSRHNSDPYYWIVVDVDTTPQNEIRSRALPALFGFSYRRHFDASCCGATFDDVAWASITRPSDQEPFFRSGLLVQESWQKLSNNPTRAYLEPFFRPGPPVGPLGAGILAYYMACEDKSVSSLAIEALVTLVGQHRLEPDTFATAFKQFLMSDALPTSRWTKGFKSAADFGAGEFVREVITQSLDFSQEDAPRDLGGMLELFYELHVAQHAALEDDRAIACLRSLGGGGKVARYQKKLLSHTP